MRRVITMSLCLVVFVFLGVFQSNAQVALRFSDWHLTEEVWNKSLTEGMEIFHQQYPNIKGDYGTCLVW